MDPNIYGYVLNNSINLDDPFGLQYWSTVWENFKATNQAIPGVLAPTGMGIFSVGKTAEVLGTKTFLSWAGSGFAGASLSGATFTSLETGVLVGGTALTNFVFTGISWEAGVGIGSLVSAIPVYSTDQNIGNWYGYFLYDLIHDDDKLINPCELEQDDETFFPLF
jgi:hypothetical protein